MRMTRYAAKRDISEAPIIEALEKAGYDVWQLDYPCDLACRKDYWPKGVVQFLECKTGRGKALRTHQDPRQATQAAFLERSGTPVVKTPEEALDAVWKFQLSYCPAA